MVITLAVVWSKEERVQACTTERDELKVTNGSRKELSYLHFVVIFLCALR